MIEQFIGLATQQLGISQDDAEQATSGLLSVLQGQAGEVDFSSLLSQIGGAEQLMNKFETGTNLGGGDAGGLMGNLMGAVGGMLGGGSTASSLVGMAGLLSQLNLDSGQLGSLASLFFDFIKGNAGDSLAQSLMGGLGDFLSDKAA
ncbi:MAG: DUF2780 domain-containing protein [Rickettsiales bacterium]|nr:DUF2780 domain-containing protein [Rickettsiales bacterium]